MKIFKLTCSSQAGFRCCIITAKTKENALFIAEKNYFCFRENLSGNEIKEINTNQENFNLIIEYDNPEYEG